MDNLTELEEPEWLERNIVGELRTWHIMFICFAVLTSLIVMICCCFRFRIPRTKQQIEADYQRRQITCKFRKELKTIQDPNMDAMSLTDALELLREKKKKEMDANKKEVAQPDSMSPEHKNTLNASLQQEGGQYQEPQSSGLSFSKLAGKVAALSKMASPKQPASQAPSNNNIDV